MPHSRVLTRDPPNVGVNPKNLNGEALVQSDMFVRCNFPVPRMPSGFDLIIPGRAPRRVTVETLDDFREVEIDMVLECAGNGRTLMEPVPEGVAWDLDAVSPICVRGIHLSDLLGPLPESIVSVVFTGADHGIVPFAGDIPYRFSLTRELAMARAPLIVTHINNEHLTAEHGGPMRLMVPGHYGMKSVKWLTRVQAVAYPFQGHFVRRYRFEKDSVAEEGAPVDEIAVRSAISHPSEGDAVFAGSVDVSGSAWTGAGDITKVEVSVDGGKVWLEADIVRELTAGRFAPIQWTIPVEFEAGTVELMSRATDSSGATQPLRPRWNSGGYANNVVHRVTFDIASEN
ncbi:MAG TPA: molybdopterin-dependent oxidoreductase [Acidimicrobiia bacterium]|nr:molybdopterin-dependent oxidoreductase [Acidimicrobiia bacterium]